MPKPVGGPNTPPVVPTEGKVAEKAEPKKGGGPAPAAADTTQQKTAAAQHGASTAASAKTAGAVMQANLAQQVGLRTPTAAELKEITHEINHGNHQKAIDLAVKYYNIDISSVKGKPTFNKDLSGEGVTRRYSKEVEIGKKAFTFDGKPSPAWLASSILHETVHAKQLSNPQRLKNYDDTEQAPHGVEVEAYDREIAEAKKTGISDDMVKNLQARRKAEYDALTPDNKKKVDAGKYAEVK
jgi:hypothetical protein